MSTLAQGNRLPLVLTAALFLLALVVALAAWFGGDGGPLTMRGVPEAPVPDADSPVTVLKTLSAQVETVKDENADLKARNDTLQGALERLNDRLAKLMTRPNPVAASSSASESLNVIRQQLSRLNERLHRVENPPSPQRVANPLALLEPGGELEWIEPLDADAQTSSKPADDSSLTPVAYHPLAALRPPDDTHTAAAVRDRSSEEASRNAVDHPSRAKAPPPIPFATIPVGSTLLNATAWTALLGRIPVGGRIADPWRFKVLTGADNLAANGIRIPGLTGMIWSGIAVGDLALSCVSGELYAVTYVFQDGRIDTHRTRDQDPLGWISDASGLPCVPGELKTNAPQWLATRTGMLALEAGAEAYANAQTTRTVGPLGGSRTTVTGNADRYALGEALSSGSGEARRWIDERQRQSFDAIFVPPGRSITLNVETEIPIDYDPGGRKVSYRRGHASPYRTSTLD